MRRTLIPAILLAATAACSVSRSVKTDSAHAAQQVTALARRDSLMAVTVAALDSPEITVEWLDTPRRRLTVRAARIRAHRHIETAASTDSAATAAVSDGSHTHSDTHGGSPSAAWWVVAAGAVLMLGLSWQETRARR